MESSMTAALVDCVNGQKLFWPIVNEVERENRIYFCHLCLRAWQKLLYKWLIICYNDTSQQRFAHKMQNTQTAHWQHAN